MAFQTHTNVTDMDDLLDKLYTFATVTDGNWTGSYNEDLGQRQIGLSQGNCHVALGARASEVSIAKGSQTEGIVSGALATSLNASNKQFWGHPGSLVQAETDSERVLINDLGEPPFSNVWFFSQDSGAHYVHVVVQSSGERYLNFTFGVFDKLGMTTADCAYLCSAYWEWWDTSTAANDPDNNNHDIGHLCGSDTEGNVFVAQNVLPIGGSWPTPGASGECFLTNYITGVMTRGNSDSVHWANGLGNILDFVLPLHNQLITGGSVGYPIPWFFRETTAGASHVSLGILPQVRIANIENHTPGDTLLFGTEEWLIFPWKRKGPRDEIDQGANEQPEANSIEHAFMYKKNV